MRHVKAVAKNNFENVDYNNAFGNILREKRPSSIIEEEVVVPDIDAIIYNISQF